MSGYLIPDNPTPENLGCMLVFYPDDPLYSAALLGSLTFLGTWVAWEKDGTTRAKLAAEAWKEANEETMATCGQNIAEAMNNIADAIMNRPCCDTPVTVNIDTPITVTIPPDDTGQPPNIDDTPIGDPNTDPPPNNYTDWPTYYDDRCKASNWYADKIIEMIGKLENIGDVALVVSVVVAGITLFFPPAFIATIGTIALLGLASDIIGIGLRGDFSFNHLKTIADDMESDKEGLVCAIYKATTPLDMLDQAVAWFNEKIDASSTALGWSAGTTSSVKSFFNRYFGDYVVEWFESAFVDAVPVDYVPSVDCSSCGCQNYRELRLGTTTSELSGLGVKTIESVLINDRHYIDFRLEENHCLTLTSVAASNFDVFKCIDGESVPTTLTAENDYYKSCGNRVYLDFSTAVTVDINIIENNPDCLCNADIDITWNFETNQGWYGNTRGGWWDFGNGHTMLVLYPNTTTGGITGKDAGALTTIDGIGVGTLSDIVVSFQMIRDADYPGNDTDYVYLDVGSYNQPIQLSGLEIGQPETIGESSIISYSIPTTIFNNSSGQTNIIRFTFPPTTYTEIRIDNVRLVCSFTPLA